MGKSVATKVVILLGEYNISGNSNRIELAVRRNLKDISCFSEDWHNFAPGTFEFDLRGAGIWNVGASALEPDNALWGQLGDVNVPVSLSPSGATAGDAAFLARYKEAEYSCFGAHGEPAPFEFGGNGFGPAVRGIVLANTTVTDAGALTGQEYVALGANEILYAALHVTAFTGTEAVIKVQSCATIDGSYSDRITFATVSGITKEWATYDTDTTDTFWRVNVTSFTGVSKSMTLGVTIGII